MNKRIFIVEDEVLLAMDLRDTVQEMGYYVVGFAMTGEEALEAMRLEPPDLVLIDIKLTGDMDGIETSRLINQRHNIPVVFLTGNTDRGTLNKAMDVNHKGILTKPLEVRDLRAVFEGIWGGAPGPF